MPTRDSNIELNLTDDTDPAVTKNPDGSITEYATPKESPGSATTENVPSPLTVEIIAFIDGIDHSDEFTDTQLKAIAVGRLHPDLSTREISERLDISSSTVSRAQMRVDLAELTDRNEIHAAFRDRTDRQQAVITALLDNPDASQSDLANAGDCSRQAASGIHRTFLPLVRHLRDGGLPTKEERSVHSVSQVVPASVDSRTDTSDSSTDHTSDNESSPADSSAEESKGTLSHSTDDALTAVISTQAETSSGSEKVPSPTGESPHAIPQPEIQQLRQLVASLRDTAITEHSFSESAIAHQSIAARCAICETILAYLDTILDARTSSQEARHD